MDRLVVCVPSLQWSWQTHKNGMHSLKSVVFVMSLHDSSLRILTTPVKNIWVVLAFVKGGNGHDLRNRAKSKHL
jgi:hypothetical protein